MAAPGPLFSNVLLSVTGLPRERREAVKELLEQEGGSYSANLSRRCTHLAVCNGEGGGQQALSEKLRIGLRNRDKWGLHIVDLQWVVQSARQGTRLDEAAFPVQVLHLPAGKEQAAPNAAASAGVRSMASKDGGASSSSSLLAGDTFQGPLGRHEELPWSAATMAAAAARAQRPADPLRQSVNSRPLSSFRHPAPSLQTQSPSVKRSGRWQHPATEAACSEGSTARLGGACSGAAATAAAAHAAAAAGMLPAEVEHLAVQEEAAEDFDGIDYAKLPMTQAGFIPAADLLQQLRTSAAGPMALPDERPPITLPLHHQRTQGVQHPVPMAAHEKQQQQQHNVQCGTLGQAQHEQAARSAGVMGACRQQRPPQTATPQAAPSLWQAGQMQHPAATASPIGNDRLSSHVYMLPAEAAHGQHRAAASTAQLLEQLRLSAAAPGLPEQDPKQQQGSSLPTDVLLEQLRASNASSAAGLVRQPLPDKEPGNAGVAQQEPHRGQQCIVPSTAKLLEQLRASSAAQPQAGAPQQQQRQQMSEQARQAVPGTLDLLGQLQASSAVQLQQQQAVQPRQAAPDTAALEQLRAFSAAQPQFRTQQQQQAVRPRQAAPDTADLLEQLRASAVQQQPGGPQLQQQDAQPRQGGLDTAALLEQLRASAMPGAAAQQAQMQEQGRPMLPTAELLAQLQQGPTGVRKAGQLHGQPGANPVADVAHLLQQLQQLAPGLSGGTGVKSACEQLPGGSGSGMAEESAAAAGLAAQLRSLFGQRPEQVGGTAGVAAASGKVGSSSSNAKELLGQLQQGRQQQCAAATTGALAGVDGQIASGSTAVAPAPGAHELLLKLRSLVAIGNLPTANRDQQDQKPLPQQQLAGQPQQQPAGQPQQQPQQEMNQPLASQQLGPAGHAQQQEQQQQQPPPAGSSAEDAELPPAKYRRQEEPVASGASGEEPVAGGAPNASLDAGSGTSLQATEAVGSDPSQAGTPANSAGAPAGRAGACPDGQQVVAARGATPEVPPAGSQVADSGCKVFGGMLAVVDPGLPLEEQKRVCAALELGGGRIADNGNLCRSVTHVVCQPEAALKWLSMGVGIVSPQWVHQSLRSGRQQRCLTVSADTSRHLPAASAASQRPPSQAAGSGSTQQQQQQLSSELLQSREARLQMLGQLSGSPTAAEAAGTDAGSPATGAGAGAVALRQQVTTPAELLGGVVWSVVEPAGAACKEGPRRQQQPAEEEDVLIIPDSEEEEEDEWGSLCCASASQTAVTEVLFESAAARGSRQGGGGAQQEQQPSWQGEVVLAGVSQLTLLLPRDARRELGLDTRTFQLPLAAGNAAHSPQQRRQLTAGALLQWIHGYYSEAVGPQEQLHLLQSFPAAQSAAAVLRPAFVDLAPLPRGALLGPRCNFEGLRKATRDPAGAVYELQLGC